MTDNTTSPPTAQYYDSPPTPAKRSQYPGAGMSYLFKSNSWKTTTLVGSVLLFLSFTVVPLFLIVGYCWRTSASIQRRSAPPVFNDWRRLFIEGSRGLVAITAPLIVFFFVLLPSTTLAMYSLASIESTQSIAVVFSFLFPLILVAAFLFSIYSIPACFCKATHQNNLRSIVSLSTLRITLRPTYFFLWLITLPTVFAALLASLIMNFIPLIGQFLSAATLFFTLVAFTAVFSEGIGIDI